MSALSKHIEKIQINRWVQITCKTWVSTAFSYYFGKVYWKLIGKQLALRWQVQECMLCMHANRCFSWWFGDEHSAKMICIIWKINSNLILKSCVPKYTTYVTRCLLIISIHPPIISRLILFLGICQLLILCSF